MVCLSHMFMKLQTVAGRLRRIYKRVYPYANAAFELWLLLYNVAYLFEKTPFYRPWLGWIGVDIRRLGIDDMVRAYIDVMCNSHAHTPVAGGSSSFSEDVSGYA